MAYGGCLTISKTFKEFCGCFLKKVKVFLKANTGSLIFQGFALRQAILFGPWEQQMNQTSEVKNDKISLNDTKERALLTQINNFCF